MFLAGDEFGNTQFGNNNAYCQDNEISWLDWSLLEKNRSLYEYFRFMIHFRLEHPAIRKNLEFSVMGFPFMSVHAPEQPFQDQLAADAKAVGILYAGKDADKKEDMVYLAINTFWEPIYFRLPELKQNKKWHLAADTSEEKGFYEKGQEPEQENGYTLQPRSVAVFVAG